MRYSAESVTQGHPDKIADQISDAILDAYLNEDKYSRVAVETLVTSSSVIIAGEVSSKAKIDIQKIVRETVKDIGYDKPEYGFYYKDITIINTIHEQSPDIAAGVIKDNNELGAGDQSIVVGYATNQSPELIPLALVLAHKLTKKLDKVRKEKKLSYLGPDGKALVEINMDKDGVEVERIVMAAQHSEEVEVETVREDLINHIIKPELKEYYNENIKIIINGAGRFVRGGPQADTGLTGRKIMVDNYGPGVGVGGGAFSGKDPTKVDRSGAYYARYIAKNIVARGLAEDCRVEIGYAIGVPKPIYLELNVDLEINLLDVKSMIEKLKLRAPIYKKTAVYGHFGREEPEFTWEKISAGGGI